MEGTPKDEASHNRLGCPSKSFVAETTAELKPTSFNTLSFSNRPRNSIFVNEFKFKLCVRVRI